MRRSAVRICQGAPILEFIKMFLYKVVDDLFTTEQKDIIEQSLLGKDSDWKFSRNFSYPNASNIPEKKKKMFGFSKLLFDSDPVVPVDKNIDIYINMINVIKNSTGLDFKNVFKIRSQLSLPIVTEETCGNIHTDCISDFPYIVCLYYVNDSDAGTVIFNEAIDKSNPQQLKHDNEVTEMVRIEPKRGRVLIFNGGLYHAGLIPKTEYKCVLNFNISMV
jgi:hypothetical protein